MRKSCEELLSVVFRRGAEGSRGVRLSDCNNLYQRDKTWAKDSSTLRLNRLNAELQPISPWNPDAICQSYRANCLVIT